MSSAPHVSSFNYPVDCPKFRTREIWSCAFADGGAERNVDSLLFVPSKFKSWEQFGLMTVKDYLWWEESRARVDECVRGNPWMTKCPLSLIKKGTVAVLNVRDEWHRVSIVECSTDGKYSCVGLDNGDLYENVGLGQLKPCDAYLASHSPTFFWAALSKESMIDLGDLLPSESTIHQIKQPLLFLCGGIRASGTYPETIVLYLELPFNPMYTIRKAMLPPPTERRPNCPVSKEKTPSSQQPPTHPIPKPSPPGKDGFKKIFSTQERAESSSSGRNTVNDGVEECYQVLNGSVPNNTLKAQNTSFSRMKSSGAAAERHPQSVRREHGRPQNLEHDSLNIIHSKKSDTSNQPPYRFTQLRQNPRKPPESSRTTRSSVQHQSPKTPRNLTSQLSGTCTTKRLNFGVAKTISSDSASKSEFLRESSKLKAGSANAVNEVVKPLCPSCDPLSHAAAAAEVIEEDSSSANNHCEEDTCDDTVGTDESIEERNKVSLLAATTKDTTGLDEIQPQQIETKSGDEASPFSSYTINGKLYSFPNYFTRSNNQTDRSDAKAVTTTHPDSSSNHVMIKQFESLTAGTAVLSTNNNNASEQEPEHLNDDDVANARAELIKKQANELKLLNETMDSEVVNVAGQVDGGPSTSSSILLPTQAPYMAPFSKKVSGEEKKFGKLTEKDILEFLMN